MGREIRKVPKGWEHPRDEGGRYIPMFAEAYVDVLQEWVSNHLLWEKGEHPDQKESPESAGERRFYAQWDGDPPSVEHYNPYKWTEAEACCFQMYENITEGTPVSPVFDTLQDLEKWLVRTQDYTPEAAAEFCSTGYAPTFIGYLSEPTTTSLNADPQKKAKDQNPRNMKRKRPKGKRP